MKQLEIFNFITGTRPILVSMPHNGVAIPDDLKSKMTQSAASSNDTDWYLDRLYQFAVDQGCFLICPHYSRYVIDLNRSKEDENLYPGQNTTELCPTTQFDLQPVYIEGKKPDRHEIEQRIDNYWQPYHSKLSETLSQIKQQFGGALLFEAHSIKSCVPRFFDGQLPDFNFGDFEQQSCAKELSQLVDNWNPKGYSKVRNGRFKGGYITRQYGDPNNNIHSIQLELSQATYLNEAELSYNLEKSNQVTKELKKMFEVFYDFAAKVITN